MTGEFHIQPVTREGFDEAVEVLCEAFYDYPVMRFVIGEVGDDYSRRLQKLIAFFTEARFVRNDRVLAVRDGSRMVAAANINLPGSGIAPGEADPLEPYRDRVWADLGAAARARNEAYGEATAKFIYPEPHFHLGMIGVRRDAAGDGHGRRLLDALHEISATDPDSRGVSLTTEVPRNLTLYEHFGYRRVGHETVGGIETWGFFRSD